jgi:hypothetical protein
MILIALVSGGSKDEMVFYRFVQYTISVLASQVLRPTSNLD